MTVQFDPHPGKFKTWEDAFAYAYRQVVKQGRPSMSGNMFGGTCLYRGSEGCKCFIGHLIPDKMYSGDLEYQPAEWGRIFKILKDTVDEEDFPSLRRLIGDFQSAHDRAFEGSKFVPSFKRRADSIFETMGWPVPEVIA